MDSFCVLPFVQVNNELNGECKPCCWAASSFGDSRRDPILGSWNAPAWRELRRAFAAGERPAACRVCWDLEATGLESPRQLNQRIHGELLDLRHLDPATGELRTPPRSLALKLSSTCALACRMCFPSVSTSVGRIWDADLARITAIPAERRPDAFPDAARYLAELETIGPHLHQISFGGGEPFLHVPVLDSLRALRPWAPQIQVHANTSLATMTRLGEDILAEMARFRLVILTLSIDGFPELHGYIRPGLQVEALLQNLARVRQLQQLRIDCNIALQALNVPYLPETFDFILRVVRPTYLVTSVADGPGCEHLDARTLPPSLKRSAARKLAVFSGALQPGLYPETPRSAVLDARNVLDRAFRFITSQDLHTPDHWARFSSFHRKLDAVHGTQLREVCPEIAAFLE